MTTQRAPQGSEMAPSVSEVLQRIETSFQQTSLGKDRWYIVALAALAGSTDPLLSKDLYLHLLRKPEFSTPDQRRALVRRLREVLVKCVSIIGVCKPIEAIIAINEHEREEDKDHSTTRQGWQCDGDNLKRGMGWMEKVYTRNTENTMSLFRDHRDFEWISRHITYGLYLSDRQILDDLDTEMVVLAGIMIQNLGKETHWHIRGTRRLGVAQRDVQVVCDAVRMIAGLLGVALDRVPAVEDVEADV